MLKIHKFLKDHQVQLFSASVATNRTEHVIANDMVQKSLHEVEAAYGFRWGMEALHRELQQVSGIEKCQCRRGRIQRNHIACAMMVWN